MGNYMESNSLNLDEYLKHTGETYSVVISRDITIHSDQYNVEKSIHPTNGTKTDFYKLQL